MQTFCDRLREIGNFKYVVSAVVLNPTQDRTYFHLIYGTRSDVGLRTFRQVEHDTLPEQSAIRERKRRNRLREAGLQEMFGAGEVEYKTFVDQLVANYHRQAREAVCRAVKSAGTMPFDELEMLALQHPLTSTADLVQWLDEWEQERKVRFEGLASRRRKLKPDAGHQIVWLESDDSAWQIPFIPL